MRSNPPTKPIKQNAQAGPRFDRPQPFVRRWALPAACLLFAAAATFSLMEFVVWNRLPAQFVGKWVVDGGEQDGATFDFYRSGAMIGNVNIRGQAGTLEANVHVEDDTLFSTTRNPRTGELETRTQKIVRITRSEFILEDERGQRLKMFRADDGGMWWLLWWGRPPD